MLTLLLALSSVEGLALALVQEKADDPSIVAWARAVEEEIAEGRGEDYEKRFDSKALMDLSLKGLDRGNPLVKGFEAGATKKDGFGFGPLLAKIVEGGGRYTFLRVRQVDGKPRPLFRLLQESGLNYHEYVLAGPAGGPYRVTDMYIYLSGEHISDLFRRLCAGSVAAQPGGLEKVFGKKNEYVEGMAKLKRFQDLAKGDDAKSAMHAYKQLPPGLKNDKSTQVLRLQVAVKLGEAEAMTAFEEFRKAYPNDACLDLVSVDPLLGVKRFAEARAAVDRLDKTLGGDPYLDHLRGNLHHVAGEKAKAQECWQRCISRDKTLDDPYWALIEAALAEKDHAAVAKWLTAVEKDAGESIGELEGVEFYADFAKSPEGKKWMADRKK